MNQEKFNAAMTKLIEHLPIPHTAKEELEKLFELKTAEKKPAEEIESE